MVMGKTQRSSDSGEECEFGRKRVKMRDLHSVLQSEEINLHHPKYLENKGPSELEEEVSSKVTQEPVNIHFGDSQTGKTNLNMSSAVGRTTIRPLDLNTSVCIANSPVVDDTARSAKMPRNHDKESVKNCLGSRGIGLDLNAEDISSSVQRNCYYPYKNHSKLKSASLSECGSTSEPTDKKDPMSIWKEMKQNGYLSSSHGGIPIPKKRGRKNKADVLKKKIELAKKEQVDRFTKIAAPSGLLNELNPGIINHVRNRGQVHSIIKAMVRSEKHENDHSGSKKPNLSNSGNKEIGNKDLEIVVPNEHVPQFNSSRSWQIKGHPFLSSRSLFFNSNEKDGVGDLSMMEKNCVKSCSSNSNLFSEGEMLAFKFSSSISKVSENASSMSNAESANVSSLSSLSVKAATVASQWLELLHEDIKGRLAALQKSKKRIRDVINTELPLLLTNEFQCDQGNGPYKMTNSSGGFCTNGMIDMHQARWTALFDQMDNSLSEEEKQLGSLLNQVEEMQLYCEQGLQDINRNVPHGLQQQRALKNESRSVELDISGRELALQAAAASIYSTCNFLSSKENVSCF